MTLQDIYRVADRLSRTRVVSERLIHHCSRRETVAWSDFFNSPLSSFPHQRLRLALVDSIARMGADIRRLWHETTGGHPEECVGVTIDDMLDDLVSCAIAESQAEDDARRCGCDEDDYRAQRQAEYDDRWPATLEMGSYGA